MRIPAPYRTVAASLVAVILLFNSGIPVTVYLCPMMSSENPTCEMSVPSFGDIPSFTRQIPACCSKYVIAERNSTPYLKVESAHHPEMAVALLAMEPGDDTRDGWSAPIVREDTGPPRSGPPLYILTSTFLI